MSVKMMFFSYAYTTTCGRFKLILHKFDTVRWVFLHIPEAESGLKTFGFCNTEEFVFSELPVETQCRDLQQWCCLMTVSEHQLGLFLKSQWIFKLCFFNSWTQFRRRFQGHSSNHFFFSNKMQECQELVSPHKQDCWIQTCCCYSNVKSFNRAFSCMFLHKILCSRGEESCQLLHR